MYNLNMSGPGANNLLNIPQGEASSTPRTPEIVNSLIAMQNPLDCFRNTTAPRLASSPPGGSDTTSSSSGSPSCVSPPSVQHTCSQLIKEGLKLTIQTKRRQTERNCTINDDDRNKVARRDEVSRDSLGDDDDDELFSTGDGLTPEDEERRKRRRERNKIAATKCRLKKREKTVNLVQESEILENQNHDLKSQIQELETQKRQLVDMLSVHRTSCTKQQYNSLETTSSFPSQNFHRVDNSYSRPTNAVTMETSSSSMYRRVNISTYSSRPSSASTVDSTMAYRRMEMAHSYERPASTAAIEPTYQRLETTVDENTSYCRPSGTSSLLHDSTIATYHNFDEDVIKDPTIMLVPYCKSSSIENSASFLRMTSDQYTCQQNLINLDNSLDYIKPETSPVYQRPPSNFGRPISVDINTPVSPGYDSHPEGLDSPSIAPNTYQHFEDSAETSFTAGFTSSGINRGCIA